MCVTKLVGCVIIRASPNWCGLQAMLAEYATNPAANWKSKDTAIYLVLALTVKGKTGECARPELLRTR